MRALFGVVVTSAVLLAVPPSAFATSCAFTPEADLRGAADVVVEGVVLSGPRAAGDMASPARVAVTRYVKGHGPPVVRVGTGAAQVRPGDFPLTISVLAGDIIWEPGYLVRVYGHTPAGGSSTARGILEPQLCAGTDLFAAKSRLEKVVGSAVNATDAKGKHRWRAQMWRGPGDVGCVYLARGKFFDHGDCDHLRPNRPLVGVHGHSSKDASTAVMITAPGLRRVRIEWAGGSAKAKARGTGEIALAVLPGHVDADELVIRAFARGKAILVDRASRRVVVDDPAGETPWKAVFEKAYPPRRKGFVCVHWEQATRRAGFVDDPFLRPGECGNTVQSPLFFAVRTRSTLDETTQEPVVDRTVVLGAVGRTVVGVTVSGPFGVRELPLSRRGRAFLAVFEGSVSAENLTLTFRRSDGSVTVHAGQRQVGVNTPRRAPLS